MPIFHPLKKTSTVFPGIDTDNVIIIPTLFFLFLFFLCLAPSRKLLSGEMAHTTSRKLMIAVTTTRDVIVNLEPRFAGKGEL